MSPRRPDGPEPLWSSRLEDYYWLHDLLRVNVGVPVWGLRFDGRGGRQWRDLTQVLPPLAPYHFEIAYGREGKRDRYYGGLARKALRTGEPVEGSLFGFRDLIVPVGRQGPASTVLYFGQYLAAAPDHDGLAAAWREVSGRTASVEDPDFDAFVSVALRLQVLPPPAQAGLAELGRLFAAHLRGELPRRGLVPRLDALRREAFVPWIPHPVWAYQAIGFDRQRPTPWHPGNTLERWMREELGLKHPPSTVLALLPLQQDSVRARILARALLAEAWAWCRAREGVTVAPWSEDGLLFLAETPEGRSAVAIKAGLRDLAEELRDFARKRLGLDCAVGVGAPVPRGERLFASYQGAVLSLQMALQTGQRVRLQQADGGGGPAFSYNRLARAARELAALYEQGQLEPLRVAADEFVRRVLEYAAGRVDVARGQLLSGLFGCLEALGRGRGGDEESQSALGRRLAESLQASRGMAELLSAFNGALRRLAMQAGPAGPRAGTGLQPFLAWLEESFRRPLALATAARQAGLSVPAFTRAFRRASGQSFAAWLRARRVQEAAMLLRGTDLRVAEIGRQCGFSAVHPFIRAFKAQYSATPAAWREAARRKAFRS